MHHSTKHLHLHVFPMPLAKSIDIQKGNLRAMLKIFSSQLCLAELALGEDFDLWYNSVIGINTRHEWDSDAEGL